MRVLVVLLSFFLAGCSNMSSTSKPQTVPSLDLARYVGRWYVISNIPYFLEKGKVATYDTYTLLPDGRLANDFTFRKGSFAAPEKTWHGKATIVNKATNAEWKVSFVWPLKATYLVLDLDTEYRWAVVGTPNRKLLWVLSRTRQLPSAAYERIVSRISGRGYDVKKLTLVPQPAE